MKKLLILVVCFLVAVVFASCGSGSEYTMKEMPKGCNIYKLANRTYNYDELEEHLDNNGGMISFFDEFDVKYYKSFHEIYNYTVVTTEKGLVLIIFDKDGQYINNRIISFSDEKSEEEIKELKKGTTLSHVMKVDPDAHYDFLYASWSEYPQISYHYFSNGNCYAIKYVDNIITDIKTFTI